MSDCNKLKETKTIVIADENKLRDVQLAPSEDANEPDRQPFSSSHLRHGPFWAGTQNLLLCQRNEIGGKPYPRDRNPHLQFGSTSLLLLNPHPQGMSLFSYDVSLRALGGPIETPSTTPAVTLMARCQHNGVS